MYGVGRERLGLCIQIGSWPAWSSGRSGRAAAGAVLETPVLNYGCLRPFGGVTPEYINQIPFEEFWSSVYQVVLQFYFLGWDGDAIWIFKNFSHSLYLLFEPPSLQRSGWDFRLLPCSWKALAFPRFPFPSALLTDVGWDNEGLHTCREEQGLLTFVFTQRFIFICVSGCFACRYDCSQGWDPVLSLHSEAICPVCNLRF